MNPEALAVHNLCLSIGGARVVDGIGFSVARGEVMALVGESGCGKSVTAQAIMRLLPKAIRQTAGQVMLDGADITALPERRMRDVRGSRLSMIFQEPQAALDPLATIGMQIAEARRTTGTARANPRADTRADARADVLRMLAEVGMSDPERRIDQYPFELSGGMCQRVLIACALIAGPAVLLADEPTTALDVTIQAQILELLRRLAKDRGTAIVLITHDMGVVADIADRMAVMYAGRIAESGPVAAVFAAPRHPYTALLLASIPRLTDTAKSPLAVIEGQVPRASDSLAGCRFAPRCPLADARCAAEVPPLLPAGPGRLSACFHADRVAGP